MIERKCAICGNGFFCYPSNPRQTCSDECSRTYRSKRHMGISKKWSEAAKQRLREKGKPPQLSKGFAAAMALPDSQRGAQHRESKVWELITPDNERITVVGLNDWARKNAHLFDLDERYSYRISAGIRTIAQSMRGKTKRSVTSYKGWQLACLPYSKKDIHEDSELGE